MRAPYILLPLLLWTAGLGGQEPPQRLDGYGGYLFQMRPEQAWLVQPDRSFTECGTDELYQCFSSPAHVFGEEADLRLVFSANRLIRVALLLDRITDSQANGCRRAARAILNRLTETYGEGIFILNPEPNVMGAWYFPGGGRIGYSAGCSENDRGVVLIFYEPTDPI